MATTSSSFRWLPTLSGVLAFVAVWSYDQNTAFADFQAAERSAQALATDLRAAGWIIRVDAVRWCDGDATGRFSVVAEMPPTETDAKTACEQQRLTGKQIRLPSGAVVRVERHNGYVMSGWDCLCGWWSIDLRNTKATLVA